MSSITISVIIPALNEEAVIGQCLSSLERQTLPRDSFEVIIVDNGSSDGTLRIAGEMSRLLPLSIIRKADVHISALRNCAAALAQGEFLAFLDADCLAPPDWLVSAIDLLRARRGVIGAHYRIPSGSSWVARAWYGDLYATKQGPVSYVPAGCLLVGREEFLRLGGFDESIRTSEDCEFCKRASEAGLPIRAYAALGVIHLGTPQTIAAFYQKQRWHGTDVHKVLLRDLLHASGRKSALFTLFTALCLLATASGAFAAPLLRDEWLLGAGPALLLLGSFAVAAGAARRRGGLSAAGLLTVLYLVYGVARALCFLRMAGRRRTRRVVASGALASKQITDISR